VRQYWHAVRQGSESDCGADHGLSSFRRVLTLTLAARQEDATVGHGMQSWTDRLPDALLATGLTLGAVALAVGGIVLLVLAFRRVAIGRREEW
jgi:hypothetical protein